MGRGATAMTGGGAGGSRGSVPVGLQNASSARSRLARRHDHTPTTTTVTSGAPPAHAAAAPSMR
jgi:hypothetical protein